MMAFAGSPMSDTAPNQLPNTLELPAAPAARESSSSSNVSAPAVLPTIDGEDIPMAPMPPVGNGGGAVPLILPLTSSPSTHSPSSSSLQMSPSPVGGGKYESTKELKQLRERIVLMGIKGNFVEQAEFMRNSETTLIRHIQLMEEFMINLDPSIATAALIYTLNVWFDWATSRKLDSIRIRAGEILKCFVESRMLKRDQVLTVIDVYVALFGKVVNLVIAKDQALNGIPMMQSAIDVIVDKEDQMVTSLHGFLFKLCLKMHAITPGLDYLYPYIRGVMHESNPNVATTVVVADARSILTYLYYGALLTARDSQWKRATSLLEAACHVPGYAVSEIQIEALKKLHVISFIAHGSLGCVMPNTGNLLKAWKQSGALYTQLASDLEHVTAPDGNDEENGFIGSSREDGWEPSTEDITGRANVVLTIMNANKKAFERDQNLDLLLVLMHECKRRAVLKVAQLYKVASLPRITELAQLEDEDETKRVLTALVDSGRLLASDDGEGFVRLELPPSILNTADINKRQQRLEAIHNDCVRLNLQAQKTPYYIHRMNKTAQHNDDEGLSMSNHPEPWHGVAPVAASTGNI